MRVTRFLWQSIYPFRFYLIGPILVMTLYAIDGSLRPYLIKLMTNITATSSGAAAVAQLWPIAFFFIGLQFLVPIAWRFHDWCALKYEPALKNHIAKSMLDHITQYDYRFFQSHFAGGLAAKISDLASYTPKIISTIITSYFTNMLALIVAMYMLWQVHIWFAIAIFVWSIFIVGMSIGTINRFGYLANNSAEAVVKIVGHIVDVIGNILTVKLFAAKKRELKALDVVQGEYLEAATTRRWFLLKFYSVQGISFALYQTICLLLLIRLYGQGSVTPGDFALILSINMWIIDSLWHMSENVRTVNEQWGAVDQALKTFYVPLEIQDKPNATSLGVSKGEIVFDAVQFHYKDAEVLFQDKSITIRPGQKVGLVGYSGSGKSTFINLILRLFDVTSGRILIDGQDIKDVTQESLHLNIGMIPQEPGLFHRTLMENIRYGKADATDEQVIEAAKKAHVHEFAIQQPLGYNAPVGERGAKISGGQRQRIAIARAILKNAPILMLDEATSQLDSITERKIQESLWNLMQGKTTIVVAHRLSTLLHMDRILVFDQGAIVGDASHKELLAQGGMYKKLWDAQLDGFLPQD
ncbi:MAG: ABC transporter ATP-binding protein [Candidatus Dependentiae bacterium]|nr:ABC transporter ATP-binding protein [Candidatus Dependentiae bacterium]